MGKDPDANDEPAIGMPVRMEREEKKDKKRKVAIEEEEESSDDSRAPRFDP